MKSAPCVRTHQRSDPSRPRGCPVPAQPDSPPPPAPASRLRLPRGPLAALMVLHPGCSSALTHINTSPAPRAAQEVGAALTAGLSPSRQHALHMHLDVVSAASPSLTRSQVSSVFLSSLMFHHFPPSPPRHTHIPVLTDTHPGQHPARGTPARDHGHVRVRLGSLTSP